MIAAALRALPVLAALACGVGGDELAATGGSAGPLHPRWAEVKWPFPIDEWGLGRAFRCAADACGVEVNLYLRPKIGFCNCTRGVFDDTELDRVGDMTLLGPDYAGIGEGKPVSVGWMRGRSRLFTVGGPYQAPSAAVAIAFNDRCDVVVATVAAAGDPARGEAAALEFLNSETVLRWARAELGSNGS